MTVLRALLLFLLFSVLACPCPAVRAALTDGYYVSPSGSDRNPGTLAAPFRTIQKAANIMVAGDRCYIRAGIYRETVTPAHSGTKTAPITFEPYKSEVVTISGADPITDWWHSRGHIYQAPMPWSLGPGNDQVFVSGKMLNEARWPSTGSDLLRPTLALAGAGSKAGEIDDPRLTMPAGYWAGATVWILGGSHPWEPWIAQTGTVTSSEPGQIKFTPGSPTGSDYDPSPGSFYYLTNGPLSSLDSPEEWWYGDGRLYLWMADGAEPGHVVIQAKRRTLAFDLSNRAYIRVEGVHVFAASISMANASHCIVDHCTLKYLSHFVRNDKGWDTRDDTGVAVSGTGNILENSVIAWSAGNGVSVLGSGNDVINCVVRDCDYAGIDSAGIRVTGSHQLVAHNTVFETGRTAILNRELKASRIVFNDISYFCMLTKDAGGTYCWETDGQGTVIGYNKFHDALDSLYPGHPFTSGPYLDNGTSNTIVDHNIVWNVAEGTRLNPPSLNNLIVANTFENTSTGQSLAGGGDFSGTRIIDNIFDGAIASSTGGTFSNNLNAGSDPKFVDSEDGNFELRPGSPAIDAGLAVPPYTDGFTGRAPDIGAYEHGSPAWTAGASFCPGQPVVRMGRISDAIILNWNAVKNAAYYRIWMRAGTSGPYTLVADHITALTHPTDEHDAGRAGQFAVSAANSRVEGPLSAPITFGFPINAP